MNPEENLSRLEVAVYRDPEAAYPQTPPFHPHEKYPEYRFDRLSAEPNRVYDAVRNTLILLGMDRENVNTPQWNPFGNVVNPGHTVLIKPNFLLSDHIEGGELFSVITHSSVLRPIVDYVYIALQGQGRIIIADTPQMDCDFPQLLERTQLRSVKQFYQEAGGFDIEIYDLRRFWYQRPSARRGSGSEHRHSLPGDPAGDVTVDLGKDSLFYGLKSQRFYGADFNRDETIRFHHDDVQQYVISRSVLSADVVILVPKLKTHKKVGVTLNIKGLVGVVTNKNCLVHCTLGTPQEGGDQFPNNMLSRKQLRTVKLERLAYDVLLSRKNPLADGLFEVTKKLAKAVLKPLGFRTGRRVVDYGDWYGNDSAWRMAVDLLRVFLYADADGKLHDRPVRQVFSVIDGIIAGEGNGPLVPEAKRCGLIVAGWNPAAVDIVCTRLMGFDVAKVKMLSQSLGNRVLFVPELQGIRVLSNEDYEDLLDPQNRSPYFNFEAHPAWKGFVEIAPPT